MEMKRCTICNSLHYDTFVFKSGHVCEDCLQQLKNDSSDDPPSNGDDHVCEQD